MNNEYIYWNDFCNAVKYENRFTILNESASITNSSGKKYQTEPLLYFTTLFESMLSDGFCHEIKKDEKIYRARPVPQKNENKNKYFSSPPGKKATPGRMNPQHISFFYGSQDYDTCIYERRPEIGEKIAVACFKVKKDLLLFDLTATPISGQTGAPKNYIQFINAFQADIQKPVSRADKSIEYIPTQVFTEFIKTLSVSSLNILPTNDQADIISQYSRVSGIQYESSQKEGGKNLVLFKGSEISYPRGRDAWLNYENYTIYEVKEILIKTEESN